MKIIIGITGGIGSGKSIVSAICKAKGYAVYDCDYMAKKIMDNSSALKSQIAKYFGKEAITDGQIDRKYLALRIFKNEDDRKYLNSIVHSAVLDDIHKWISTGSSNLLFIESAILTSSGIDKMCDHIWMVDADEETRINRVIKRNAISREEVIARINSQKKEHSQLNNIKLHKINNNDNDSLLIQINQLLNQMS